MGQREWSAGTFGFMLSLAHVGGLGLLIISCSVVMSLVILVSWLFWFLAISPVL